MIEQNDNSFDGVINNLPDPKPAVQMSPEDVIEEEQRKKSVLKKLQETVPDGIRDYDELAEKANSTANDFNAITEKQKRLEAQLTEISELKKHIINYSKTKDVYIEYRKHGYSKKFFEGRREEITLHKAAKEAFSKIDGKIPKIKELNEEYAQVLADKKKTYAEYRQAKQEMKEYQTAKYNVEQFLKKEEQERQAEKQKTEEKAI